MSSEALKENQGDVWINSSSEAACDIFTLEQPTGRPSILRQSQADNISKAVHRGAKVCFQTPRRDPVTKKIMSPSRTSRPSSQEDSNKALETLTLNLFRTSNSVTFPDDDMPVQSRGAYTFNLDNLDAINPFMGSSKMQNSPPKSSALPESWTSELVGSDTTAAPVSVPQAEVPEVTDTALDETLPFVPSVENSLVDCSANLSSAEGTVIIKTDNIENSNEETLKQYAQNCMDRLQKEEKRYQALKAHAEEKLDHANKAIAEVRTKQGAEVAALQVQLKREQLKVQSLEKDLEQKVKEVKDVTELCDELLLKVQKHGF
uniref:Transforming, acidic coiled-coil containing protein 3 n=1 Tax=Cyprinus carpio TaxID=7962 RepID=A0A8C2E3D5_CYPCA